jgi:hypothetical protein
MARCGRSSISHQSQTAKFRDRRRASRADPRLPSATVRHPRLLRPAPRGPALQTTGRRRTDQDAFLITNTEIFDWLESRSAQWPMFHRLWPMLRNGSRIAIVTSVEMLHRYCRRPAPTPDNRAGWRPGAGAPELFNTVDFVPFRRPQARAVSRGTLSWRRSRKALCSAPCWEGPPARRWTASGTPGHPPRRCRNRLGRRPGSAWGR